MAVRVRQRSDRPGWWLIIDHNKKRKKKHFPDKETAMKVARRVREKLALGEFSIPDEQERELSFGEYFDTWLKGYGPTRLKPSTQALYWSAFRCHLQPAFGETSLSKITREQVKRFLYEKVAAGFSKAHVRNLLAALQECLNHAVEDGHLAANPAAHTSKVLYIRPEEKRSRAVFLSPEDEAHLLATCREHFPTWFPLLLTFLRLGVRIGEVCALQWADFDLETRQVLVRRNYVDGEMITPKNGKGRRLDVSQQLADTLKALLVERKKETLQRGWRTMPPWVFINKVGKPVDPDNFRSRQWTEIIKKAGFPHFTPHSLRHTFASRLLENNAPLPYVQHAMGHHSAAFTLQVYGHLQSTGNRDEVDKLDTLPSAKKKGEDEEVG